jgi:pimeloyl-ACP methyl ester carboxylesterase
MPRAFFAMSALAAIVVFSAAGCGTIRQVDPDGMPVPAISEAQLAGRGPVPFTVEPGVRSGEYARRIDYEVYRPAEERTGALVVLAHGFLSDLAAMRGWAGRWASFGVTTAVLTFRNSTAFAGRHDRNAEDMVALAHALSKGPVVYAGFSAGGLSAYLAAASDARAIALLGLDAVDSGGLALAAEPGFAVPALFLMGESSSCNAKNNMLPAIPERDGVTALRVRDALHCYFQDPWNDACEAVCGEVVPVEAAERIADTIRVLATAWLLERTGARPGAGALIAAAEAGGEGWARRVEAPR